MWNAEEVLRGAVDAFIERWKGIRVPDRAYSTLSLEPDIHTEYIHRENVTYEQRTQKMQVRWIASGEVVECTLTVIAVGSILLNADETYPLDFEEKSKWEIERIRAEWNRPLSTEHLFFEASGTAGIQAVV